MITGATVSASLISTFFIRTNPIVLLFIVNKHFVCFWNYGIISKSLKWSFFNFWKSLTNIDPFLLFPLYLNYCIVFDSVDLAVVHEYEVVLFAFLPKNG